MKYSIKYFTTILFAFLFACGTNAEKNNKKRSGIPVEINVTIQNTSEPVTIKLFKSIGYDKILIDTAQGTPSGSEVSIQMKTYIPAEGIYFLGTNKNSSIMIILDGKEKPTFVSPTKSFASNVTIKDSPANIQLHTFLKAVTEYQTRYNQLNQQYFLLSNKKDHNAKLVEEGMNKILEEQAKMQKQWLNDPNTHPVLLRLVKVYYFEPYNKDKHSKYPSAKEYFEKEFWAHINLKDTLYGYIPPIYDKMGYYTNILLQYNNNDVLKVKDKILSVINQAPKGTTLRRLLYLGAAVNSYRINKDLFVIIAEKLGEEFPTDKLYLQVKPQLEALKRTAIGQIAPDIELTTPEGGKVKPSDFRGKYLLIDFWASWCMPCRKENPNVVRVYNKYKDKGFEILGISLDRNKDRWIQAIKADGLIWHHGSDLKGWQSEAAKLYGVSSIPQTFLLNKEGRIIAKGLRGPALEQKLKEIFGE